MAGIAGYHHIQQSGFLEKGVLVLMIFILMISSLWGFFINKKQLPFFNKQPLSITLSCLAIALAWSFISPLIVDFLPFDETAADSFERIGMDFLLGIAITMLFTFLQIGVVGHGLLKNYLFKQVILTVAAVSIVMVVPQAVIGLLFQTLIMFYIYYRTASFQLPLIMTATYSIVEDSFKWRLGGNIVSKNYIRLHLTPNDNIYYVGLLIAFCVILAGLYFIKQQTTPISWQRPEEDEDIALL